MVEYGIAIGYGIIVDSETMQNIYNHIEMSYPNSDKYDEVCDTFCDLWNLEIDSWGDIKHFIGVYHNFDVEGVFVKSLENYQFKDSEINEFLHFVIDHGIYPVIANLWKPELLLIHYSY